MRSCVCEGTIAYEKGDRVKARKHFDEKKSGEADVYEMVFEKLSGAPIKPVGIGLTVGYIETAEAKALVQEKLATIKANGGFDPAP